MNRHSGGQIEDGPLETALMGQKFALRLVKHESFWTYSPHSCPPAGGDVFLQTS